MCLVLRAEGRRLFLQSVCNWGFAMVNLVELGQAGVGSTQFKGSPTQVGNISKSVSEVSTLSAPFPPLLLDPYPIFVNNIIPFKDRERAGNKQNFRIPLPQRR